MTARQVELNLAGTLEWYPPEGVPSSSTVSLVAPTGTAIIAATAATVDSVSTTIASATRGDETVTVASATGIVVGRRYWMATAGGRGYAPRVLEVTGTTVRLDEPLRFDLSTATFKGFRLTYSLTTTHTATRYRACRVIWRYTADSVVRAHTESVDIVRWPFDIPITEADVERLDPLWGDLSADYHAGLAAAVQDELDGWLRGRQLYPDLVRDRRALVPAACYRALQLRHARERPETSTLWGNLYTAALDQLLSAMTWYDADDDLADAEQTAADGIPERIPASYMRVG